MICEESFMKPVGICINLLARHRSDKWELQQLEKYLQENNIPFEYVDCYRSDIISILPCYSVLFWHYDNYVNADQMEAQHILDIAENMGVVTYPNHYTGWHFDDKIAEMYAFQAIQAPIPQSWVFYEKAKCLEWLKNEAPYPLVAKLRRGSGANNVKLLKTLHEARQYAGRMFGRGHSPAQSLLYKSYSKIQSTRNWATFKKRFRQIPDFLSARLFGRGLPDERGYCYFQEFTPNKGFDLKVVVVNDKCSFLVRNVRKGSFKASGGGDCFYDRNFMSDEIIRTAFEASRKLQMQCVGFDFIVDTRDGQSKIIEMCYGFDAEAIHHCNGYWDRNLQWHEEPLNVPCEIMKTLLDRADKKMISNE